MTPLRFRKHRIGLTPPADDCFACALVIAAKIPYKDACDLIDTIARQVERRCKPPRSKARRGGVYVGTIRGVCELLGWEYVPCKETPRWKLCREQFPLRGKYIVSLPGHVVAVVNGTVWDTKDRGVRAIYGYWRKKG